MKTRLNFIRYIILSLVLVLSLSFIPNLDTHATETGVDLLGDSSLADVGGVRYGVSYTQIGYLVF